MKNVIIVAIFAIALASCQKEQITPNKILSNRNETLSTKKLVGNLRIYYDNGGSDYGCKGSGGNCLPDVVITSEIMANFNDIFDVLHSNNATAIRSVFNNQKEFLEEYIDTNILQLAINGEYNVKAKGDNPDQTRYIIFVSSKKGSVEGVYPITKQ